MMDRRGFSRLVVGGVTGFVVAPALGDLRTADLRRYAASYTSRRMIGGGGVTCYDSTTTGSLLVDTLYALPVISPSGVTYTSLEFQVNSACGAGGVGRAGIYSATSDINLYPDALIVDGGEFVTTSATAKTAAISVAMRPWRLYWLTLLLGKSATGTFFVRPSANATSWPIFGCAATLDGVQRIGLQAAQEYAALPATFPAEASYLTDATSEPTIVVY